jgi:hypothetical protein
MGHKLVSYCILGQFALRRTKEKRTDNQTLFLIGRNELLCRMVSNPEPIGTPAKQKQQKKKERKGTASSQKIVQSRREK